MPSCRLRHRTAALLLVIVVVLAPGGDRARAGVYNLHLATDNVPDLTDMDSFIRSATGIWKTPREKCIAIWRWARRLRRQTSCAVEGGRLVWDPILHYNSYGAMNCGVVSALNIACWVAMGYKARYIQLGDHTVSEVSWDDGKTWHIFDSSMSIFCFNHRGEVASCREIAAAGACALSGGKKEPGHCYLYHYYPPCATHPGPTGWRCAADQPVGYDRTLANGAASYTSGFSVSRYTQYARYGRRYVLGLRSGESYTRYWEPLDDAAARGGPSTNDPDFFRPMKNGSDPDDQHGLNDLRGNGRWVFEPELQEAGTGDACHDYRPVQAGRPGWYIFKVSAANVITSLWIEGRCRRATKRDSLRLLVSRDAGIRWLPVWEAPGTGAQEIRVKLRGEVAGSTECLVKVELAAERDVSAVALVAIKITTTTQLNRRALPALTLGSNRVLLRSDGAFETTVLWPRLHGGAFRDTALDAHEVASAGKPDGMYKATIGAGANREPCHAVWRVEVPTDIRAVTYGVIVTNRSPQSYVSLLHSWDGKTFTEFHRKSDGDAPFDQQVLHRIVPGDAAGVRAAYLKCVFFCRNGAGTYNMPGIQDLFVRVDHEARDKRFRPIEVTYDWTEHRKSGDVHRSHTEIVRSLPHEYRVSTGGFRDPTMHFVRMRLVGGGASGGPKAVPGYADGVDVRDRFECQKVVRRWGRNLALARPYTTSRPSSAASGNPDTGGRELTNGTVIAPTDLVDSKRVQAATAFWDAGDPVVFTLDLGASREIAGVRVATHQPNGTYCHPARIRVEASRDGRAWEVCGAVHHDAIWQPPGDYEPWEHDDDPDWAALPAAGRLAYSFPIVFENPARGRFVRFRCVPISGRGIGVSELQVFDHVDVRPWPGDVLLGGSAKKAAGKPAGKRSEAPGDAPEVRRLREELAARGWILFAAKARGGSYDLFEARPDGSSLRNITASGDWSEYGGRFSPDGKRILYRRLLVGEPINHDLWGSAGVPCIAGADGSSPKAIGKDGELPWASWGPEGKRVACLYKREGKIRIIDLATGEVLKEMPRRGIFQQLFWSPDGKWLCGTANLAGRNWNIVRLELATGKGRLLSRDLCCTPDWFCTKPRVVYSSRRPGLADEYGWTLLMQAGADGKERRLVYAERERHVYFGRVSPDDRYVIFSVLPRDGGVEAPMAVIRLADAPMIVPGRGGYPELEALEPGAKHGPVLRLDGLPEGFEPDWTYAELPAAGQGKGP